MANSMEKFLPLAAEGSTSRVMVLPASLPRAAPDVSFLRSFAGWPPRFAPADGSVRF